MRPHYQSLWQTVFLLQNNNSRRSEYCSGWTYHKLIPAKKIFSHLSQRAFTSGWAKSSENFGLSDSSDALLLIGIDNQLLSLNFSRQFFPQCTQRSDEWFSTWDNRLVYRDPVFILQTNHSGQVHAIDAQFIHQIHIRIKCLHRNVF